MDWHVHEGGQRQAEQEFVAGLHKLPFDYGLCSLPLSKLCDKSVDRLFSKKKVPHRNKLSVFFKSVQKLLKRVDSGA